MRVFLSRHEDAAFRRAVGELVAAGEHGDALRKQQGGEEVAGLALAELVDGWIVGGAFGAHVPALIVGGAVLVILSVGLVVFLVVADQVAEGEAVVGGDEVDAGVGLAAVVLVEVAGTGEAVGEIGELAGVALPELADGVAVLAVPLGPEDGEVADLVAAFADVPGLGDKFDVGEDGVLVDGVEEAGEAADVVKLAGEGGGEIETEAVDVHLGDPVAERVHEQLKHLRIADVEGVAGAGVVHVVPGIVLDEAVVGGVADAFEAEGGAALIALAGVVVNDVEDDLDAGGMEVLDHLLELGDLTAAVAHGAVAGHRGEEAKGVVAPVVGEALVDEVAGVDEVMDGEELDGGDAELLEVVDAGRMGEAGVGAAEVLGHVGIALGEAFDVYLVDDGVGERNLGRAVVAPVEVVIDDDGFGDAGGVVLVAALEIVAGLHLVGEHGAVPVDLAADGLGVGIDEELGGVEAVAFLGLPRAVDAEAVALAGADVAEEAVPDEGGALAQVDAVGLLAGLVEEAELDAGGVLGVDGEVGSDGAGLGAERVGLSGEKGVVHGPQKEGVRCVRSIF